MTGTELMAVIGFFLMLMGTIAGVWRRVENKVDRAKKEAMDIANSASLKVDLVSAQLQEHRIHVAQEYISKSGQREMMDGVMEAIAAVVRSVDGVDGFWRTKPRVVRDRGRSLWLFLLLLRVQVWDRFRQRVVPAVTLFPKPHLNKIGLAVVI